MAGVSLKNITKSFVSGGIKKEVLKNINLEISDTSFCVLLGASGCGKSTLLRLIAGLETADSGEIFIGGKNADKLLPKDRDIAFVFQSYALYPHMNVYENMAFPLKIRGLKKEEINKKIMEASSILGLDEFLKRKPKELSGGQRQRVALGRAIVREAKVFLMDEPLSNLDAKLRANMRVEIKKLHQKLRTTFIYVTHDQTEALTMGDEIVILNEGTIFQKGTPDEIFKAPKNTFVASFSGAYPMNLLNAVIENGFVHANGIDFEIPPVYRNSLSDRTKVIMGIRPENIELIQKENNLPLELCIDFVENTGAIKILHLNNGMKAVVNSNENFNGSRKFFINPDSFIFFDYFTKNLIEKG
ncbi:MAG: ATP-binding cassette domain-containing protein [Candidatus Gastranaerophilales bacterium]|nr:ATP-binding cassette domain-containing protein [Candidatus Gastranaerophilales bacterium]